MNELEVVIDELERAWDGDPWHGTALGALLDGVSARAAAAHPLPAAHSIWELMLHLTAWTREVTRRARGAGPAEPADGDWPRVGKPTEEAWKAARQALGDAHRELLSVVRELDPAVLGRPVGGERNAPLGSGVSHAVMLHGLAQHHAYHAGQIALLRKATG